VGIAHCLRHWECDAIAQVDGHLKQAPSIVGTLYDLVMAGTADLALLDRYALQALSQGGHRRNISSLLSGLIASICGVKLNDAACGTRCYSVKLGKEFAANLSGFGYGLEAEQVILAGIHGLPVSSIPISSNPQLEVTTADKILDNFLVINTYAGRMRASQDALIAIAHAVRSLRLRRDFKFSINSDPTIGDYRFKYVGHASGVPDGYVVTPRHRGELMAGARNSVPMLIDGITLLVEVTPGAGTENTSKLGQAQEALVSAFDGAQRAIVAIAKSTASTAGQLGLEALKPQELEVKFGLKFAAEGSVILAGASGEASLEVTLKYSTKENNSPKVDNSPVHSE
jgi:hypothetical protein